MKNYNNAMLFIVGLCTMFGTCVYSHTNRPPLTTILEWKQLEFDYDTPEERQADIDSKFFKPGVPVPFDTDFDYTDGKVFITAARFMQGVGVPVTLGTVTEKRIDGNPVIKPFPDWSWHRNPELCAKDRLISVFRIKIDECHRLWVLDTGTYGKNISCPPQLLAFSLTGKLLDRFTITSDLAVSYRILATPMVDVRNEQCSDTFVYIADCRGNAIIVYDMERKKGWKIVDKTLYAYPEAGTFTVLGEHFELMDGVLGLALEPYVPGKDRKLFYHSFSSFVQSWVYTSYLRNETFINNNQYAPQIFNPYETRSTSQSCSMAMDRDGIIYFGLIEDVSINCWNTASPDYGNYIDTVYQNTTTMQFASGVKVINDLKNSQELWVLTTRFQKYRTATMDPNEVNFRISVGKVSDLAVNTKCKSTTTK